MSTASATNGVAVGIGLAPEVVRADRSELLAVIDRINASPIDHVIVTDHVAFRGGRGWDAVTALAYLVGLGLQKPIHTGVLILPLRHPTILARQLLDLADLHEPGLTLGVGVGGDDPAEYEMAGMSARERGKRMDDSLELLAPLLAEQRPVQHEGFSSAAGPGLHRGAGKRVPILVGGRAPAAHRRAATTDGWIATFCSAKRFAEGRASVLDQAGEDRMCGYQAWVGIGDDGRAQADRVISEFYGLDPAPFHRYTPAGDADEIVAGVEPYVAEGCELLHLFAASANAMQSVDIISTVADTLH